MQRPDSGGEVCRDKSKLKHQRRTQTLRTHASAFGEQKSTRLLRFRGLALETLFWGPLVRRVVDRFFIKLPGAACKGTVPALVGLQRAWPVAIPFAFATKVQAVF